MSKKLVLTLAIATLASGAAFAQDNYPNKVVRVVVPFAAAGAGDVVTRLVAQGLTTRLGQSVIVENRPGAGGEVGASIVAKAAPDGYTLAFASIGYNLLVAMRPNTPVDPGRDLAPIGLIGTQPYVLIARNDAPFKSVGEFAAYAKANPGKVNFAHAGVGTLMHLLTAWIAADAGVKVNEIPFNGAGPAMNSILGGQTDIAFDPPATAIPQIRGGKVRVLATTGNARMDGLNEAPTLKELGHAVVGNLWFGLMAPAGTPRPIIDRLNKELNAVLQSEETKQRLTTMRWAIEPTTPEAFGKFFQEQTAIWTRIIRDNNVKATD